MFCAQKNTFKEILTKKMLGQKMFEYKLVVKKVQNCFCPNIKAQKSLDKKRFNKT